MAKLEKNLRPRTVTFFCHDYDWEKPTISVSKTGKVEERRKLTKTKHAKVYLQGGHVLPSRKQIEAARKLCSVAINANMNVTLIFKGLAGLSRLELI